MVNTIKHIIPVILCLLSFSIDASSQDRVKRTVENMVLEAVEDINNGFYKEASETLKEVLAVDPSSDAAWYYMGQLAILDANIEEANRCYAKAIELDPENYWYRYRHANINRFISIPYAIELFEGLIEDFPKKNDLYLEILDLYISEQEYETALEVLAKIETIFGASEQLAIYTYRLYYTLNREDEGLEYLRKYNSQYSSPIILTILAEYEMAMNNEDLTFKYFNEAIDLDPTFPDALRGKAEACRIFHHYEEYFPALNQYIESPNAPAHDKTDYLNALVEKSDPKFVRRFIPQIDTTLMILGQTHQGDSLVYDLRGRYYYYTGRMEEAHEQFHVNMQKNPESISIAASYIEFLMYANMWQKLSEEGRKAYKAFPHELGFLEMAGIGDYNLGDYYKTLETCDIILAITPNNDPHALRAWSTKGDIYYMLGDVKRGFKAYDDALKIDPKNAYVLNNYAYFLVLEGKDLKKAYQMSKTAVEVEPENANYLDTFGWILYLRGDYREAKSYFKQAMRHGGKESAVILDHYAEVLYALGEYDMAFVYWNMALRKNTDNDVPGLKQKIEQKRRESGR